MGNSTHREFAAEFHQSINPAQAEFDRLVTRFATQRPGVSPDAQSIDLSVRKKSLPEFNNRKGAESWPSL